jgi:hypothetical protein
MSVLLNGENAQVVQDQVGLIFFVWKVTTLFHISSVKKKNCYDSFSECMNKHLKRIKHSLMHTLRTSREEKETRSSP